MLQNNFAFIGDALINFRYYLQDHPLTFFAFSVMGLMLIGFLVIDQYDHWINKRKMPLPSLQDVTAIAGDSINSTQLDLARAYMEIGRKQDAVAILENILQSGSHKEQQHAKVLLSQL